MTQAEPQTKPKTTIGWGRDQIAARAALQLQDGYCVNLGIGMIRGGHIDLTVLGAMEVAENGDIAN